MLFSFSLVMEMNHWMPDATSAPNSIPDPFLSIQTEEPVALYQSSLSFCISEKLRYSSTFASRSCEYKGCDDVVLLEIDSFVFFWCLIHGSFGISRLWLCLVDGSFLSTYVTVQFAFVLALVICFWRWDVSKTCGEIGFLKTRLRSWWHLSTFKSFFRKIMLSAS